jgi:hypothetical protein
MSTPALQAMIGSMPSTSSMMHAGHSSLRGGGHMYGDHSSLRGGGHMYGDHSSLRGGGRHQTSLFAPDSSIVMSVGRSRSRSRSRSPSRSRSHRSHRSRGHRSRAHAANAALGASLALANARAGL